MILSSEYYTYAYGKIPSHASESREPACLISNRNPHSGEDEEKEAQSRLSMGKLFVPQSSIRWKRDQLIPRSLIRAALPRRSRR